MPRNKVKQRKKKLYERLAAMCEVPCDVVSDIPVFVIRGRHEVEASGCSGVREYCDSRVVLAAGGDIFTVTGDHLVMTDFSDSVLFIRGNIDSAFFGCREEESCL